MGSVGNGRDEKAAKAQGVFGKALATNRSTERTGHHLQFARVLTRCSGSTALFKNVPRVHGSQRLAVRHVELERRNGDVPVGQHG